MAKVQFISETKLKENSFINGNVDDKILVPLILDCQIDYILPIIGTGIFNELSTQITNNTLTSENTTLLQLYIQPCLIKYVEYEAPMVLNFKFTNANIGKKNTDESVPLSLDEMNSLTMRLRVKAEMRAEKITKFLRANFTLYPLFINPGSAVDTVHPQKTNYTCGLFLGSHCDVCYESPCCCMTNMRTSSPN